jgi:hypothetical protein
VLFMGVASMIMFIMVIVTFFLEALRAEMLG